MSTTKDELNAKVTKLERMFHNDTTHKQSAAQPECAYARPAEYAYAPTAEYAPDSKLASVVSWLLAAGIMIYPVINQERNPSNSTRDSSQLHLGQILTRSKVQQKYIRRCSLELLMSANPQSLAS